MKTWIAVVLTVLLVVGVFATSTPVDAANYNVLPCRVWAHDNSPNSTFTHGYPPVPYGTDVYINTNGWDTRDLDGLTDENGDYEIDFHVPIATPIGTRTWTSIVDCSWHVVDNDSYSQTSPISETLHEHVWEGDWGEL